ncbi:MAG TPA: hypothetical protein VEB67_01700 [Nitrososphaerales archaeon]|nr:hypothetical protein [Nitrososphaerales archaeon]
MESAHVRRGSTMKLGRVEGDLVAEDHALLQPADGHVIVVTGRVTFEGSVEVDSSLECDYFESSGGIARVNGDLTTRADVEVDDALYTRGNLKAGRVDVGGKLYVGSSLLSEDVDVGGSLEVQGDLESDRVDVGGSVEVLGELKAKKLDVGGRVELGGGGRVEDADVGGTLASRKPLSFGRLDVGGTIELEGGEGDSVDVGGRLRSYKALVCKEVEVGGYVEVDGGLSGDKVQVGGKLEVTGDLRLTEGLQVGGFAEVRGEISAAKVTIGESLRADKCVVQGSADIGHRVETQKGLKADAITLGKAASVKGPLVGNRVDIGVASRVEDVWCSELTVDRASKVGRVWTDSANFASDCQAEGVTYTKGVEQDSRVRFSSPPQKVDRLPPNPI